MMKKYNDGSKFMLLLMIWSIVFILLLMFWLGVLSAFIPIDIEAVVSSPWMMIVFQLVMFILPMVVWMAARREPVKSNFLTNPLGKKNIIIIVVLSFLLQPLMMTLSGISALFFNNDVAALMYSFQRQPFLLQLFAMAVTPAICEELVFRGYIQAKYRNHTIKQAALINGLFFALIHMNFQQFLYAFVLGVIFAYMVHYTRSIWAGILPHFIINGSQVVLSRVLFALSQYAYADAAANGMWGAFGFSEEVQGILIIWLVTLGTIPIVVPLFGLFVKHNRERITEEAGLDNAAPLSEHMPNAQEPEPEAKPWSSLFDPFAMWVIVVYVVFMALITLVS